MADNKEVWIQNTYRSPIEIIIKDENNNDVHFVFGMHKVDRITGTVLDDGYTTIERTDYDKLVEKSQSFNKLVKDGMLIVYNEAPLAAMSDIDRIIALQEEVNTLRAENKTLKEENEKLKKKSTSKGKSSSDKADTEAETKAE